MTGQLSLFGEPEPAAPVADLEAPVDGIERWAEFSPCGRYRYLLGRRWSPGLPNLFILTNPSKAGAGVDRRADDPTVIRLIERSAPDRRRRPPGREPVAVHRDRS